MCFLTLHNLGYSQLHLGDQNTDSHISGLLSNPSKRKIAFLPPSSLKCELLFVDFVYSIGEDWREATPQIVVVDYQGHIHGGGTANVSVFILYLVPSWGKLLAPSS